MHLQAKSLLFCLLVIGNISQAMHLSKALYGIKSHALPKVHLLNFLKVAYSTQQNKGQMREDILARQEVVWKQLSKTKQEHNDWTKVFEKSFRQRHFFWPLIFPYFLTSEPVSSMIGLFLFYGVGKLGTSFALMLRKEKLIEKLERENVELWNKREKLTDEKSYGPEGGR